jgi:hypothetical protein
MLPLSGGTMTGNIVFTDSTNYKIQGSGNDGWDNSWIFSLGNNMTNLQPELLLSVNTIDHGNNHAKTTYNNIEIFGEDTNTETSNTSILYKNQLTFTDNVASTSAIYSITGITFPDESVQTTAASAPDLTPYALLASPTFTGTPVAPTATTGNNSTQIATTAFVQSTVIAGSAHAETLQATVRNNTGSTLNPFTVVYISGAVGNKAAVAKAQANSEATSSGTFAVTESSIANNADGTVISAGVLSGVNTSAFADGDKLYLSPTTAGGVTTTKPYAPNHLVYVGVVTRSHVSLGTVNVRIQNGYELDELHNVSVTDPSNNNVLVYETSSSLWKDKSVSTALGYAPADTTLSNITASTARTNLGLGSSATNASTVFAQVANNLSDVTASTARTNLGLTSLATASFATDAQVIAGTSASTVMSPANNTNAVLNWIALGTANYANATSTGTVNIWALGSRTVLTATASGQYAISYPSSNSVVPHTTIGTTWSGCDFSKRIKLYGRIAVQNVANQNYYYAFGRAFATISTIGSPATKGFGIRMQGTGAVELQVHNGTTLTNVTSSFTPTNLITFDCLIDSIGDGNVNLYINGSLVATSSGGATGTGGATHPHVIQETSSTASSGAGILIITNKTMYMA